MNLAEQQIRDITGCWNHFEIIESLIDSLLSQALDGEKLRAIDEYGQPDIAGSLRDTAQHIRSHCAFGKRAVEITFPERFGGDRGERSGASQ